ncbi:MAG TPA: hypothetical protein ENJ79_00735 [Gammaproteobacteria bacterium]|nr:hypothetical protein [Gammaproteobacteria bacterium]
MPRLRALLELARPVPFAERHQLRTPAARWLDGVNSLDDYLALCRRRVAESRTDLARTDLPDVSARDIIDGNSPFLLQPEGPARGSLVMLHGLTDSPFVLRDLAAFFCRQGLRVLGVQLPGHGTRPGDLLALRWQDWASAHARLIDAMAAGGEPLYLMGFSLGASLSLYQALLRPRFRGLFLFAPALGLSPLVRASCPLARLGRLWPRAAWFDVQPDHDPWKYESLTQRAICEVHRLLQARRRLEALRELDVPLFVVASARDATLDAAAVPAWFARQRARPRRMLWYDDGRDPLPVGVERLPAADPARRIRSYAHTSLLNAPDNPWFGEQGGGRYCVHYYRLDPEKYRRCRAGGEDCLGEMFDDGADCRVIRRLTYNPRFDDMLERMLAFMDELDGRP